MASHSGIQSSLVSLGRGCPLPQELAKDQKHYGAVEPKYGLVIKVHGASSEVWMRRFFLLDVFASAPFHPRDGEGKKLPKRFRLMNPRLLCKDLEARNGHFSSTTTGETIRDSGNIAFASSGAFSRKQFQRAMQHFKHLYGPDVNVTVIDLRKEFHWIGDGEPFSQHTFTNHQNMHLSLDELIAQEKEFIKTHSEGVTVWARRIDEDITPVLRRYSTIQTEEDLVLSEKHTSYVRMPLTDHTALDLKTTKRLYRIIKETVVAAQRKDAAPHVVWFHCLGGQGRASGLTFAAHVIARRELSRPENPIPLATFEALAKHIWYGGGKDLSADPNPDKRYKYNGAICRRGCLQALVEAAHDSKSANPLIDRICIKIQEYCERHRELWEHQVDPSDFAEALE